MWEWRGGGVVEAGEREGRRRLAGSRGERREGRGGGEGGDRVVTVSELEVEIGRAHV